MGRAPKLVSSLQIHVSDQNSVPNDQFVLANLSVEKGLILASTLSGRLSSYSVSVPHPLM